MEDMILSEYVRIHGEGNWRNIPKIAGECQKIAICNGKVTCIERLNKRLGFVLQVLSGVERVADCGG